MEIIKKGVLPSEQECIAKCLNCDSVIKWKAKEGQIGQDYSSTIKCPVCAYAVTALTFRAKLMMFGFKEHALEEMRKLKCRILQLEQALGIPVTISPDEVENNDPMARFFETQSNENGG